MLKNNTKNEGIERFLRLQEDVHSKAIRNLRMSAGFQWEPAWTEIEFPAIEGVRHGLTAVHDLIEAREMLAHPVLGKHIPDICAALTIFARKRNLREAFGAHVADELVEAVISSATLFLRAAPTGPHVHVYLNALSSFNNNLVHSETHALLEKQSRAAAILLPVTDNASKVGCLAVLCPETRSLLLELENLQAYLSDPAVTDNMPQSLQGSLAQEGVCLNDYFETVFFALNGVDRIDTHSMQLPSVHEVRTEARIPKEWSLRLQTGKDAEMLIAATAGDHSAMISLNTFKELVEVLQSQQEEDFQEDQPTCAP